MVTPFLGILQTVTQWDQSLFELVNSGLANPFFDAVTPFLRNSMNWAPLYLFLLLFMLMNFKARGAWWAIFFLVTVAATDMVGTYIFKHNIMRLRPCNDPSMAGHVRLLLDHCAGGSSFISNHAANHFGMAAFFFITTRQVLGSWSKAGFFWAFAIAFSQVYVGVHYPLDAICGALLGVALGLLTGSFFNRTFGFAIFDNQPAAN